MSESVEFRDLKDQAMVYANAGDYKRAIDLYTETLKMRPENAYIHNDLGAVYHNIGVEAAEEPWEEDVTFTAPQLCLRVMKLEGGSRGNGVFCHKTKIKRNRILFYTGQFADDQLYADDPLRVILLRVLNRHGQQGSDYALLMHKEEPSRILSTPCYAQEVSCSGLLGMTLPGNSIEKQCIILTSIIIFECKSLSSRLIHICCRSLCRKFGTQRI